MDGDFKDGNILFDKKRRNWNNLMIFFSCYFILTHLVVFIFDDEVLDSNLIFWRNHEGYGAKYFNLGKSMIKKKL